MKSQLSRSQGVGHQAVFFHGFYIQFLFVCPRFPQWQVWPGSKCWINPFPQLSQIAFGWNVLSQPRDKTGTPHYFLPIHTQLLSPLWTQHTQRWRVPHFLPVSAQLLWEERKQQHQNSIDLSHSPAATTEGPAVRGKRGSWWSFQSRTKNQSD